MGCDIHLYKEKHVDGAWVTAETWVDDDGYKDVPWRERFTDRNYELFGLLANGVRRKHAYSFEPRGLPPDACDEVASRSSEYGVDGHSHSYLYLHELRDLLVYLRTQTIHIEGMKDAAELQRLNDTIVAGKPDWDLLFPYSAGSNLKNDVHFELDVPATFYVGEPIERIIASFDGVDGDNHRIVFWFDN